MGMIIIIPGLPGFQRDPGVGEFVHVSNNNNNDSENHNGRSHAAVDLECFGTFYQLETVSMVFLMKCFTLTG